MNEPLMLKMCVIGPLNRAHVERTVNNFRGPEHRCMGPWRLSVDRSEGVISTNMC